MDSSHFYYRMTLVECHESPVHSHMADQNLKFDDRPEPALVILSASSVDMSPHI